MAEKVLMPQLGESVSEGTISKWLVKVGDIVKKYDPICEVSTDKVNAEVPSSITGTVTEIIVGEGETVAVGTLICTISSTETEGVHSSIKVTPQQDSISVESNVPSKPRYSPAVLKLAQENNLDLTMITGTGAGGRITRKDVLAVLESGLQEVPNVTAIQQPTPQPPSPPTFEKTTKIAIPMGDQEIPVTNIRRTIAKRMVQSKQEAPHAWTMTEVDVTGLVKHREAVKDEFRKQEGINLTYLPFFIKAVVEAIKEFPLLNSVWTEDKIIVKKGIHISIAVAMEDALYVPVIRDADQKNILGLAKSIHELVGKTREGKLTMDDITGGTFTCNNTGSFGSVLSAPIINPPQVAILTMEAIVKRPVVFDNMIAIRDTVNLCLSLDHRVLDGLICGKFLQSVKSKLEAYGKG